MSQRRAAERRAGQAGASDSPPFFPLGLNDPDMWSCTQSAAEGPWLRLRRPGRRGRTKDHSGRAHRTGVRRAEHQPALRDHLRSPLHPRPRGHPAWASSPPAPANVPATC